MKYILFLIGLSYSTVGFSQSSPIFGDGNKVNSSSASIMMLKTDQKVGIGGITAPTARLHVAAGTASANTAPFKMVSGVVLSSVEDGAMEYDGLHIYFSIGATRYQLDQQGGSATTIYNGNGTLSGNRNLSGDNKQLNLGVPGSKLSGLAFTTSGQIFFDGQMQVSTAVAADADYSITLTNTFIILPDITANRNVSLSSPGTGAGKLLIIWNKNSGGNSWTFTNGTVVDATGAAITNLTNDTTYILMNDGTDWVKLN